MKIKRIKKVYVKRISGEWRHHAMTLQQINPLEINNIEISNFPCP